MPEISFPCVEGVTVEYSMEGSQASSLDTIETSIDSDADKVDPLMSHDEEVGYPFKRKQGSLDLIPKNLGQTLAGTTWNFW